MTVCFLSGIWCGDGDPGVGDGMGSGKGRGQTDNEGNGHGDSEGFGNGNGLGSLNTDLLDGRFKSGDGLGGGFEPLLIYGVFSDMSEEFPPNLITDVFIQRFLPLITHYHVDPPQSDARFSFDFPLDGP